MIFLDTNVTIAALNDRPRIVADTLAERMARGDRIAMSTIVLFELWFGIAKGTRRQDNTDQLGRFLTSKIEIVTFDEDDASVAGEVRAALRQAGIPIGLYDILIAGQALRHGATLVTANTREFSRVEGLKVEDWSGA